MRPSSGDAERAGARPTPPTEPVRLAALLGADELELRLLAGGGPAGVVIGVGGGIGVGVGEVDVHGVHASEMADPSPYLLGGELLLTAGAGLARAGTEGVGEAREYVQRLVRAGVAALGFGVTPVHEVVPRALVEACDLYGLPLLEVPPRTPFTAVARAVWRLMAQARTRELRRVTEAQQSLAAAAARPDPVPAVLTRLAGTLGGWAALLTPAPEAPATAAPEDRFRRGRVGAGASPQGAERTPARPSDPSPRSAPEETPRRPPGTGGTTPTPPAPPAAGPVPGEEVLAAVGALARRVAHGGVATATDTLGGTHLAAYAAGGGRVLAVATPARSPGDHTIASVAAVLLSLLTASRPAGTEAAALTRLLLDGDPAGALAPRPWYAVHARGAGDPQALAAALGTVLLDPRGPVVRLLTDREPGTQPGWRLGVSAATEPEGLPSADAQAGRALERAEAARTPMARHRDAGFAGLVGEAEARAHAEALLAPLSPVLRDTLRAWLAHHGSWDRTATALGVHRNTVRQRMARTAALLGRDLDDADVRMELWFALRQDRRA
ncbi:PucR family transcriptional regulator [Streptomyces sp. NBC_01351]|uniref:PucR family transcriptional regulator n=1 Tax=Streptomyces sp. NBC_01351 TaxID=2903833 RepID=UPI002E333B5C|nr:PucR family transcriptional regulator [Streptomyces sp. NBC_01351]